MFSEGIFPIGDGLLDIDEERLKTMLVPDDINEIYEVEQTPFARGKFAAVRRAIHKNSGVHFAAKFLKRRRRAQSSDKEIKHEIAVLMLCKEADNIVKLNAVHESRSDTALLLELATGGELQTHLDNEECLNEGQARVCMREVLKALQFLHKRSIVHLDLKPQNILMAGERIEDGLKLCDFGISRVVTEGTNVREIVGTPDYVAPEVLQYEPLSLSTDIWSVGVLTYVLLSGFSPFGGETKQETFLNISQCALTFPDKLFGGVSSAAIDFMRKALRIKPSDRMTAAGCLDHIWLKDECNIDRHIFTNKLNNKQQLEHEDEDAEIVHHQQEEDDDDDDDDDDEEDVDDDGASNVYALDDEEEEEVVLERKPSGINGHGAMHKSHDAAVTVSATAVNGSQDNKRDGNNDNNGDNEVVALREDKPEAICVDQSEEEEEADDCVITTPMNVNNTNNSPNSTTTTTTTTTATLHGHLNGHVANGRPNGHANGSVNGHLPGYAQNGLSNGYANGHAYALPNGRSNVLLHHSNGSVKSNSPTKNTSTLTIPTTKTTAVHNVPATKAITIPLGSMQQPHQQQQRLLTESASAVPSGTATQEQQFLHIPARRQSSDSNKENTFLATKKIAAPPLGMIGIKKPLPTPVTQSTTIVIKPSVNNSAAPHNIVATITLPTSSANATAVASPQFPQSTSSSPLSVVHDKLSSSSSSATTAANSFFPDAPTTPKVIRKAPTTDTSPTSVKALVRKFQLEVGEQPMNPPEFATNGSKTGGALHFMSPSSSPLAKTNETKTKYINGRTSVQTPPNAQHATTGHGHGARRASEPITAIHNVAKKPGGAMVSSSAPVSIPLAAASNHLKASCVYCSSSCSGCRQPSTSTQKNGGPLMSCNTSTFSQSTKSLINESSSNGSLTSSSSSSNGTTLSNGSSNALLYGNHQQPQHLLNAHHAHHHQHQHQHQHHHHHHHAHLHHHGVVKSAAGAANGLSLDQGIIC